MPLEYTLSIQVFSNGIIDSYKTFSIQFQMSFTYNSWHTFPTYPPHINEFFPAEPKRTKIIKECITVGIIISNLNLHSATNCLLHFVFVVKKALY